MDNRLSQAFKDMRKQGLLALQNFTCCQSCGNYEGWTKVKERGKKGLVFFHRQDAERRRETGRLHLAFTGEDKEGFVSTQVVGEIAVQCLKANGLLVEWNGSPNTRILVKE